jgi:hypothetical protein
VEEYMKKPKVARGTTKATKQVVPDNTQTRPEETRSYRTTARDLRRTLVVPFGPIRSMNLSEK